jgi:ADP-heptose:LPS heptosyltransferase
MDPLTLRDLDRRFWPAATTIARLGSWCLRGRRQDSRPLIVRPGGMGDLIVLCIAVEQLGYKPTEFAWLIERRSRVWARHLGLEHVCYDEDLLRTHWQVGGRFRTVINSEQFFGLSQATALLACGRGACLTCFDSNRAHTWADRSVTYDPDRAHESTEFRRLLGEALRGASRTDAAARERWAPATGKPIVGLGGMQTESRAFSENRWSEFIRAWAGNAEFRIAASEVDRPVARRLAARFPNQAELFEGDFDALCDLIRFSEEVLTVDSGFLHIASYYGVPVTGIFTSGREDKWAPLAPGSRILRRSDLSCQPCTWFGQVPPCPNHYACKEIDLGKDSRSSSLGAAAEVSQLPALRSGPPSEALPVGTAVHADRALHVLPDDVPESANR